MTTTPLCHIPTLDYITAPPCEQVKILTELIIELQSELRDCRSRFAYKLRTNLLEFRERQIEITELAQDKERVNLENDMLLEYIEIIFHIVGHFTSATPAPATHAPATPTYYSSKLPSNLSTKLCSPSSSPSPSLIGSLSRQSRPFYRQKNNSPWHQELLVVAKEKADRRKNITALHKELLQEVQVREWYKKQERANRADIHKELRHRLRVFDWTIIMH